MTNRIPTPTGQLALSGKLLVATNRCADGMFAGSVCLILQHDSSGSVGLVLNKSLDMQVDQLWKFLNAPQKSQHHSVRFGGPISGPILALHNQEECAEVAAASGVYIAAHLDKLQQLVTAENSEVRIVVGQVLWKGGQLEHELLEGMWLPLPATPKLVFASADEMWQQSMREVGNNYLSMITGATPPVNVQWN